MELLGLFGVLLVLYLLLTPAFAWLRAGSAIRQGEEQQQRFEAQQRAVNDLSRQLRDLREQHVALQKRVQDLDSAPRAATSASTPTEAATSAVVDYIATPEPPPAATVPAQGPRPPQRSQPATFEFDAADLGIPEPAPIAPVTAPAAPTIPLELPDLPPSAPVPAAHESWNLEPVELPPEEPVAAAPVWREPAAEPTPPKAEPKPVWKPKPPVTERAPRPDRAEPPRSPPRPRPQQEPTDLERGLSTLMQAVKGWLFGGNLVAKIGLMILFIGVAFLLRFASAYVVVPIEVRLAGIAAGAIAMLLWGWRIRTSRPGIALPAQGAGLATLMLVTFGAFKLYHLLPAGAAFALLLVLVTFTCILAVLQDALWLAVFGIVGGFAVPILTSTGEGSHVALFSYYALLNAGILAIAWKRSWRSLNLLGFLFTFVIGTAWGVQRYEPEHYLSSQFFLALFLVFYVAIAVLYAWRQAPQLKSYVDGTLVFGVPTVAMGLQYGMVKDMHLGSALSALALGVFYALVGLGLWRWRRGNLRLLVESFLALAVVFGTLAIPLAFDGRWTSAAWALEGAGIVWVGLRQKQALVWRFGILVQFLSWIAFLRALTGIDPVAALTQHISLGFALLGATGVFLALTLRRHWAQDADSEDAARAGFGRLAGGFIAAAVVWLLAGMWVEIWLRVDGVHRASLYVLTAILLVVALQWLGRREQWRVPDLLGGAVTAVAGLTFLGLMAQYMRWYNVAVYSEQSLGEILSGSALFGGLLLGGGALVSAFAFKRRALTLEAEVLDSTQARAATQGWYLLSMFWTLGFALNGLAHVLAWLTTPGEGQTLWYTVPFWAAYSVLLALAAAGYAWLARRQSFPNQDALNGLIWPALTALAIWLFLGQISSHLHLEYALAFDWSAPMAGLGDGALLAFLGGPLSGTLVLLALVWMGARRAQGTKAPGGAMMLWLILLGLLIHVPLIDTLALLSTRLLVVAGALGSDALGWLSYADARLVWMTLAALFLLPLAQVSGVATLRRVAIPSALMQALASLVVLGLLYVDGSLPRLGTGFALLAMWLGMAWCLRYWQQCWGVSPAVLKSLHFGRVIAPWLMVAPLVSLNLWPWLVGADVPLASDDSWVVAGMWPDYLAAWVSMALLLAGLRQVRAAGWPLEPLHAWYGQRVIPIAAGWALLLAIYWNLRQDGSMAPLPYLPVLNPLDLTSGFVALLLADLWRLHAAQASPDQRRRVIRASMALGFAWFNAMLLRTAAHYLGLPYRFEPLYQSQFVQAMLSLVWTLCAFALMRYAVRRLSKPLWMIGAALLGVVVVKLFLVDLRNVGSVARIVSFMGVGGLMLLIGYLAPLPREAEERRDEA